MKRPDHYYAKAKKRGFAARSIFKLEELNEKFRLIRPGMRVLDLGSAPGSWLQYVAKEVGEEGEVLGIDLDPLHIPLPPHAHFVRTDIVHWDSSTHASFDVVLSDMAPKTTGNRIGDHLKSIGLCEFALDVVLRVLRPSGDFVCKMYQGEDSKAFLEKLNSHFKDVKSQKPSASRRESREVFFVARGYQPL